MAIFETYIGSFKKGAGAAILKYAFDSERGTLTALDRYETVRPSYLLLSEDKNTLFCINEAEQVEGEYGGAVESIDLTGGQMRRISRQSLHAKGPSHLCLHKGHLIVSVYGEGALVQAKLNENREILPITCIIKQFGHGVDPERQTQSHPHFVTPTPCGKYIAVADLGLDKLLFYPFDVENGLSLGGKTVESPAGVGPRHMLYSPDGHLLYVLTEIGNSILVYRDYKLVYLISTLPPDWKELSWGSALRFTPDKTGIAASNRLNDTIALFNLGNDGIPVLKSHIKTGKWPRDFEFTPDGRHIIVANQNDDTLVVYRQSGDSYEPCFTAHTDILPCCVVFGKQINTHI